MRWKKLKKIFLDHPYFEYPGHALSEIEAERILETGYLSWEEFIQRVWKDLLLPIEERQAPTDTNKSKKRKPFNVNRTARRRLPHSVQRVAIVFAVLLCLTVFFTLTQPGIALAHDIYQTIVRFLDNTLLVRQSNPPSELPPLEYESLPKQFSSLEEAADVLKRPIVNAVGDDAEIVSINLDIMEGLMVVLQTECSLKAGGSYYVSQNFYDDGASWGAAVKSRDGSLAKYDLPNDVEVYIGTMDDGTVFAEGIGQGFDFRIMSQDISLDDITNIATGISFIEP